MLFYVGSHMDRFDIFNIGETGSPTPVLKSAGRLIFTKPNHSKFQASDGVPILNACAKSSPCNEAFNLTNLQDRPINGLPSGARLPVHPSTAGPIICPHSLANI